MSRQTITKTIDEKEYTIHQRGARESLKLFTTLVKLFGVPASKALDVSSLNDLKGLIPKEGEGEGATIDISGLVSSLADRLDEGQVVNLVMTILNQTMQGGLELSKPEIFDQVFSGQLRHLMNVIIEVLKVEYTAFPQDDQEQ